MKQIMYHIARLFLVVMFSGFWTFDGKAQSAIPYGNEWIDYAKTYHKFKVAQTGLYRINKQVLDSIGLGTTPAEHFQLWAKGKEVPIFVSKSTGPLANGDYIEFVGYKNDGELDSLLFQDRKHHLNKEWSLSTDSAAYFLTVNTSTANKRITVQNNGAGSSNLTPETYFWHTYKNYYKQRLNQGEYRNLGLAIYGSIYDKGEGWTSREIGPGSASQLNEVLPSLQVYTGAAPAAEMKFGISGNGFANRPVNLSINNTTIGTRFLNGFEIIEDKAPIATTQLAQPNPTIQFLNASGEPSDRIVVHYFTVSYPRTFNADSTRFFPFELPASNQDRLIEIGRFISDGAPVLIDENSAERWFGVMVNGKARFLLPPSTSARKLILLSGGNAYAQSIAARAISKKNYTNYNLPANQGNYLMVANKLLAKSTAGLNALDEYQKYRSSVAGGNYNAKLFYVDELEDQFAYGVYFHSMLVKNFLRFGRDKFASKPKMVYLMGRGITYGDMLSVQNRPDAAILGQVPTFGIPASDNLLAADFGSFLPMMPVGRIAVVNGDELLDFLDKVKQYESVLANNPTSTKDKLWTKQFVHLIGSSDKNLENQLIRYMSGYRSIAMDTLIGADVVTFSKTSTDYIQPVTGTQIESLFKEGIAVLDYFGHSAANTLEFSLADPEDYDNQGKYPLFIVSGCNAGGIFSYNPGRLAIKDALSDKYTLAKQRGSIAFIASTSFGVTNYLDHLITGFYKGMSSTSYGKTLGEVMLDGLTYAHRIIVFPTFYDLVGVAHINQETLHGDPGLKIYSSEKPDYNIEVSMVKVNPSPASVADGNFKLDIRYNNLGRARLDSIKIQVKQIRPNRSTALLFDKNVSAAFYADSLATIVVPIRPDRDKGRHQIQIQLDADGKVEEISELNNRIEIEVDIVSDEAIPVYPYHYAIINKPTVNLVASTAEALATMRTYKIEMDTTEAFNSGVKRAWQVSQVGGVIAVNNVTGYAPGVVQYWRIASFDGANQVSRWSPSSFVYLPGDSVGFSQGHYYQHLGSEMQGVALKNHNHWEFNPIPNNLFLRNAVFPVSGTQDGDFTVSLNGDALIRSACVGQSFIFNVFDRQTFNPWFNAAPGNPGQYGSGFICQWGREFNFEFEFVTVAGRKKIMDFMDLIPDGSGVTVRNILNTSQPNQVFYPQWMADTSIYGSGKSLYHYLKNVGFIQVDSFYRSRAVNFVYKKNDLSFTPKGSVSAGIFDKVILSADLFAPDDKGQILSPVFGPASSWSSFTWSGRQAQPGVNDSVVVRLMGIDANGNQQILANVKPPALGASLRQVNAKQFPYVQIGMAQRDTAFSTPYILDNWRLWYSPVPEGAVAPNLLFNAKDTIEFGEQVSLRVPFVNVSNVPFDSVLVKAIIVDKNNVPNVVLNKRFKPLPAGDSLVIDVPMFGASFIGSNTLFVEFNPDNDQPEQQHFNNYIYKPFFIKYDGVGPLMDVTFDGIRILNRDIVSPKPHIQIKLNDESRFFALDDTSLVKVFLKFPTDNAGADSLVRYYFNADTLQFVPANLAEGKNEALINFYPHLLADGEYELIVQGQDRSGNRSGPKDYHVLFEVINKSMISDLFNYPNPFTTSTAFVFTLTGSEVPDNFKIQILTITGKIVREVTKEELGPIRIGRNLTEFKWDGTDQFGQRLANGVYLYRVITTNNGKTLEKYNNRNQQNTDKYFKQGYGKMYLMR